MLLISVGTAAGQILPAPDLQCAATRPNGDVELTWNLPTVSCGPFNTYNIYASNSITGPFSILTSITNQATTSYLHTGANGNVTTWYYYMQSDYNCPGYTPASSDTLDNLDPVAPAIQFVTVENGNAELHWNPFVSPETYAFIIYRYDGGFVPIDTVFGRGSTSFIDLVNDVSLQSEQYTIAAMDSCGNVGPFYNNPHQTILLNTNTGNCIKEINLTWSEYVNWNNGVADYTVYTSINGGAYTSSGSVSATDFAYTFTNFNDGDRVCLYVEARESSTGFTSKSNVRCVDISFTQPAAYNYLLNATVNNDNIVELLWRPDVNADLKNYKILRSTSSTNFNTIEDIVPVFPIPPVEQFLDSSATVNQHDYYYQIDVSDSCDQGVTSGVVHTILLEGTALPGFTNKLEWNPFEITYGTVTGYKLFYLQNGIWQTIATLPASANSYNHQGSDPEEDVVACYRVEASANMSFPDGMDTTVISSSNTYCVEQNAIVYIPTAFVPEGVNNVFKPSITFGKEGTYQMLIFNRWGQQIFETNDLNKGWDGRYNGELVQQGVYSYYITVTGENNKIIERKGTVMVIR